MFGLNGGLLGQERTPTAGVITPNEWVLYRRLPAWTPAAEIIATLLWLDAADVSTFTEVSGRISAWADKSLTNRDATQGTAAQRPKQTAAALNGKSVVEFDPAANSFQRLTFSSILNYGNLFFVAKKNDVDASSFVLTDGSAQDTRGVNYGSAAGSDFIVQQITGSLSTATRNNWHIAEVRTDGTNASLGIDGSRTTNAETDLMTSSDIGWYRNSDPNFVNQYSFRGQIAEIIIYGSPLDTALRQKVEGYLAHKWGLLANLPADHPYKIIAPTVD